MMSYRPETARLNCPRRVSSLGGGGGSTEFLSGDAGIVLPEVFVSRDPQRVQNSASSLFSTPQRSQNIVSPSFSSDLIHRSPQGNPIYPKYMHAEAVAVNRFYTRTGNYPKRGPSEEKERAAPIICGKQAKMVPFPGNRNPQPGIRPKTVSDSASHGIRNTPKDMSTARCEIFSDIAENTRH